MESYLKIPTFNPSSFEGHVIYDIAKLLVLAGNISYFNYIDIMSIVAYNLARYALSLTSNRL